MNENKTLDIDDNKIKKRPLFIILGIFISLFHSVWLYLCYKYMKVNNTILYPFHSSGLRFLKQSIVAFSPALIILFVTILCFRKNFYTKTDMVKPNRYHFTLFLTTLYTFLLPVVVLLSPNKRGGVATWVFYLFFLSYLQIFLFLSLVPFLLEKRGGLNEWSGKLIIGFLYSLSAVAYPLSVYDSETKIIIYSTIIGIISFFLYYFLRQEKKWSGALWLSTITYALLALISSFLFESFLV